MRPRAGGRSRPARSRPDGVPSPREARYLGSMEPRAPLAIAALTLLAACSPAAPAPIAKAITAAPPPALPRPAASAIAEPGAAPAREVRDIYFGTTVVDPYRWMEAPGSREFATWLQVEGAHARRTLDALPDRAAWLARIQELDHAGSRAWDAEAWGGKYFYLVAEPGKEARCLYVRDGIGGPERLLVDPDSGGAEAAIEAFTPSIDGRLVAYVTTAGVLHVVETGTGHALADTLDRVQPGGVAWLPDGRLFFYTRFPKPAAGRPAPPARRARPRPPARPRRRARHRRLRRRPHPGDPARRRRRQLRRRPAREPLRLRRGPPRREGRAQPLHRAPERARRQGHALAQAHRRRGRRRHRLRRARRRSLPAQPQRSAARQGPAHEPRAPQPRARVDADRRRNAGDRRHRRRARRALRARDRERREPAPPHRLEGQRPAQPWRR